MRNRRTVILVSLVALGAVLAFWASGLSPLSFPRGEFASLDIYLEGTPGGRMVPKSTVTAEAKINAFISVLRRGTAAKEHHCADTGILRFQRNDGTLWQIGILPGHDGRYFEYRVYSPKASGIYRVNRASLYQAMAELGVSRAELDLPLPE